MTQKICTTAPSKNGFPSSLEQFKIKKEITIVTLCLQPAAHEDDSCASAACDATGSYHALCIHMIFLFHAYRGLPTVISSHCFRL